MYPRRIERYPKHLPRFLSKKFVVISSLIALFLFIAFIIVAIAIYPGTVDLTEVSISDLGSTDKNPDGYWAFLVAIVAALVFLVPFCVYTVTVWSFKSKAYSILLAILLILFYVGFALVAAFPVSGEGTGYRDTHRVGAIIGTIAICVFVAVFILLVLQYRRRKRRWLEQDCNLAQERLQMNEFNDENHEGNHTEYRSRRSHDRVMNGLSTALLVFFFILMACFVMLIISAAIDNQGTAISFALWEWITLFLAIPAIIILFLLLPGPHTPYIKDVYMNRHPRWVDHEDTQQQQPTPPADTPQLQ